MEGKKLKKGSKSEKVLLTKDQKTVQEETILQANMRWERQRQVPTT